MAVWMEILLKTSDPRYTERPEASLADLLRGIADDIEGGALTANNLFDASGRMGQWEFDPKA